MSFTTPALLWLLVVLPAAALIYLGAQRRRPRYAVRFTNLSLLANVIPRRPAWRRHLPPVLYLLALGGLIMALARPAAAMKLPRQDGTVMLVMDVSGSMDATDVQPTRLRAAVTEAEHFVDQLPGHFRVGVVAFSSDAQVLMPPTDDRLAVRRALESMRALGGTAMGDGIERALDFARSPAQGAAGQEPRPVLQGAGSASGAFPSWRTHDRLSSPTPVPSASSGRATGGGGQNAGSGAASQLGSPPSGGIGSPSSGAIPSSASPGPAQSTNSPPMAMVLLSDGANNMGQIGPEAAAQDANRLHVPIYTIALGTPTGMLNMFVNGRRTLIPVPPDPATLQQVAQLSGGRFFAAPSDPQLHTIYDHLASRLAFETQLQDITPVFIAIAALLLLVGGGLSTLWFHRFP